MNNILIKLTHTLIELVQKTNAQLNSGTTRQNDNQTK